ncbi:MAG: outer membrane beta-barrel protein, partial [Ferruginibacter sp.]
MRKIATILLFVIAAIPAFSQTPKEKKKKEILSRAGDHLMLQFSYDNWTGTPDSIDNHIKGLNRGANFYVMYDMPFKGDPRFSVAAGVGVGTSNIYFKKMTVDITSNLPVLPFTATDTVNNFKKYKLATTFIEVPLEFRFSASPEKPNKSVKIALGVKLGTMLNAHNKGKTLRDASGKTLISYTEKNTSKNYFNTTRLAATARIG